MGTAIKECCESLADMLLGEGSGSKTSRRDIELLRDFIDLDSPGVEAAIRQYLDPDSRYSNRIEYCGLALIGFDLADYEQLCNECATAQIAAIDSRTADWAAKFKAAVDDHGLAEITIDAFCIPFHSVEDLRKEFLKALGRKNEPS